MHLPSYTTIHQFRDHSTCFHPFVISDIRHKSLKTECSVLIPPYKYSASLSPHTPAEKRVAGRNPTPQADSSQRTPFCIYVFACIQVVYPDRIVSPFRWRWVKHKDFAGRCVEITCYIEIQGQIASRIRVLLLRVTQCFQCCTAIGINVAHSNVQKTEYGRKEE